MFRDKRLLLVIGWMLAIFIGSSIPGKDIPGTLPPDYILHFTEYAILGALVFWWINTWLHRHTTGLKLFSTALFCSFYGIMDELHQGFVPGRSQDPRDWLADTIGGLAGALLVYLIISFLIKKHNK